MLGAKTIYCVMEINTKRKYKDDILDILYGDEPKIHRFETEEERNNKVIELNNMGIKTHIAKELRF